ncbi:MAG TPA: hypothetical protein VKG92_08625 [Flavobacteriales bacterium]|nr:hypothetical protein [Flavobacteriales bacterium]
MFTHSLFLVAALASVSAVPFHGPSPTANVLTAPVGGPPRISLANKDKGDITKAEWAAVKSVELHGCVPDAHITALTLCIKDCGSKDASLSTTSGMLTKEMLSMIANLPAGTPFTVKVAVRDGKNKAWEVPDATYVWRG